MGVIDTATHHHPAIPCGGQKLAVKFFDVSQGLSALVTLPDGRHVLVDTGDVATRAGCGPTCATAHQHLVQELGTTLGGKPIDLLWITHQHSDHIGGALDLVDKFAVGQYTDNGRDLSEAEIKKTHAALKTKHVTISAVEPGHTQVPIADAGDVKLSAIVPSTWLSTCHQNRNLCSIMLRVDYCKSSILFTGDAEAEEEAQLDPKAATLVQVGHHGSDTSTTAPFLAKIAPKYAVISAGKKGDGMNKSYCHPRQSTVRALTTALGGAGSKTIQSFDAKVHCDKGTDANWIDEPASDQIWATERDGDVTLATTGDGKFAKE
jgi:competence protein ComEC